MLIQEYLKTQELIKQFIHTKLKNDMHVTYLLKLYEAGRKGLNSFELNDVDAYKYRLLGSKNQQLVELCNGLTENYCRYRLTQHAYEEITKILQKAEYLFRNKITDSEKVESVVE